MRKIFLIFIICQLFNLSYGQDSLSIKEKVYRLNYKVEVPVTVGLFALNFYGFHLLGQKSPLDSLEIIALDQNDVWAFDRKVFSQNYPVSENIYTISDIGLWTAYLLPALLFIDRDIRKSWLDITVLYLETQAINLNLYLYAGPVFTTRVRPLVYMEETSWDYKLGNETTDSFFSGHVAMVAGASFFMAKVISDYHPELGGKKWLVYGAALIPPAFVGYYRYRGFMHFPTDLLVGLTVGAAVGILNPHFHKITKKKNRGLSIVPFTGPYTGVAFSMRF